MSKTLVRGVFILLLLLVGCSNKKYYSPKEVFSASFAISPLNEKVVNLSREGTTLASGKYLSSKGLSNFSLKNGFRFLNENEKYVLATNPKGMLKVIDKETHQTFQTITLKIPVVSATIKDSMIAYVLNNNSFGLYDIASKEKLMQSRSGKIYAIDTRSASPMFIDNIAVFPMLDGKIIIVNSQNTNSSRVVYISSSKVFNNVIFLSRIGDIMVASTSSQIITLGGAGKKSFKANISEVVVDKEKLYLFTKEGEVKRLSSTLEVLASKKYKFVHYSVATAFDNKLYALDQQGTLIVMNDALKKTKNYDLGKVDEPAYISQQKLYKDGEIIDLSQLGYE